MTKSIKEIMKGITDTEKERWGGDGFQDINLGEIQDKQHTR